MTKRDPHADNDLIDDLAAEGGGTGQGSAAGGDLQRDVGSRAELNEATASDPEPTGVEKGDKRPEPPQSKTNRE